VPECGVRVCSMAETLAKVTTGNGRFPLVPLKVRLGCWNGMQESGAAGGSVKHPVGS